MKVQKKKNEKRERENIEKNNKVYEDYLIFHNQDLAQSLLKSSNPQNMKIPTLNNISGLKMHNF